MDVPSFDRRLLEAISQVHAGFLQTADARVAFADLLAVLLELTESTYGFIGEVLLDPQGAPYLKTQAITDISWDEATRAHFRDNAAEGLDFRNLKTLFGAVMATRAPVIANGPGTDPRRGGLPPGHPRLDAFMGLPCHGGGQMLGMVGVANRRGGYDDAQAVALEPLLSTCANLLLAHRAVRERRVADTALRRSELRLRLALEAGKLNVWDVDLLTGKIALTDQTNAMIGAPGAPTDRDFDRTFRLVHPDEREAVRRAVEDCISGVAGDDFVVESRTLPGETVRWVSTTGRVVRDEQGRAIRLTGTMRDVTEEKAMTLRMKHADRLAAVGTLAAGVGHEINNPLTFVQSNLASSVRGLEALRSALGGGAPATLDDVLGMLGDASIGVDRIATIVRQLRAFSRADERLERLDPGAVIRIALRMAEPQLRDRAELIVEVPGLPRVDGQEGALAQVFLNLLVNAAQALGDRRDGRGQIRVVAVDLGDQVMVSISDTGAGIPDEVLPHVFDPFFTTKAGAEGTGLGLAISRQIVENHRGELRISSTVGEGTRADVVLPVSSGVTAAGRSVEKSGKQSEERPPIRILLIDDEPMIVRALSYLLEPDEVVACTSALVALEHLERGETFDLVLCDLLMPQMTGMELYRRISSTWPDLARRCLFMSGGAFTAEANTFVASSGRPCLDKPIDEAALRRAIQQTLDAALIRGASPPRPAKPGEPPR